MVPATTLLLILAVSLLSMAAVGFYQAATKILGAFQ